MSGRPYRAAGPIRPPANRPVFLAGLRPRGGRRRSRWARRARTSLGVERRVGRGRVLMLTVNPTDPALAAWPGLDTLVRRVVLRRPEETSLGTGGSDGRRYQPPTRRPLAGARPDLVSHPEPR